MRRIFSLLSVLLIVALALGGCASPTTAPANSQPEATQPQTESSNAGQPEAPVTEPKILTIIDPVITKDWSPLRGGGQASRQLSLWWAPPLWADMQGNLHPMVFASWEASPDFKVWTFKIDPNAKFSDGSPITAEDVKGTWELSTQPLTKHQRVSLFFSGIIGYDEAVAGNSTTLPGIVVKDAHTVEVTLKAPDPIFVNRIATNMIGPVKISQARGADGQEVAEWWHADNKPAVSGPFMPVKMDIETGSVTFEVNPNWWGPKPNLTGINYIAMEDGSTALLMLKRGEADINMHSDLPTTYAELGPEYVGTNQPATPVLQYFWINSNVPPMDDINCRKALVMAANPEELFRASHPHGPGEFGTTLLAQLLGDQQTNQPVTNNPEGAKAAFAECKYKDAMPKIYIAGTTNPQAEVAAQTLIEQWRQVLGIQETELVPVMDKLPKTEQDKVQVFRDDVGTRVFDSVSLLLGSIHSKSGNAQSKMGGYNNDAIDQLIDEALALPPTDPNRNAKAIEAEALAIADFVYIPWYDEGPTMHHMPWVLNYSRNIDWQIVEPWNLDIDLSLRP
ncbi:MAG: ABC transporter substrate-binding protein [Chloroflexota bacterium]